MLTTSLNHPSTPPPPDVYSDVSNEDSLKTLQMKMLKKTTQIQVRRTQDSLKREDPQRDPLQEKRADLDPSLNLEGTQFADETGNPKNRNLMTYSWTG